MSLDALRTRDVVTTRQLIAAGCSRHRISALVRRGAIARLARGIYAIGDTALPDPVRVVAAFDGALSYVDARLDGCRPAGGPYGGAGDRSS